jgi:hypothetical protein
MFISDPDPNLFFISYRYFILLKNSVAEPVHFCPAPAPASQKFRLQLGQFPRIIKKNSTIFIVLKKNSCFLKTKMIIKRFFKVNSNEIVIFKVNFKLYYEKFRVFVTFYKNLHTRRRSRAKNFGSGSSKKLLLHRLLLQHRLRNTA